MMRVFSVQATELMSGSAAPMLGPDPKGTRPCELRIFVDDAMRVYGVQAVNIGVIQGIPRPSSHA